MILPHPSRTRGQRRTATAAVLRIRGVPVLAYAVHLETPVQITPSEREDQARAILRDAASFPGPVVIAGDFNGEEIGLTMRQAGYRWLTEGVGPTVSFFNWDHIFVRRLSPAHRAPPPASSGGSTGPATIIPSGPSLGGRQTPPR